MSDRAIHLALEQHAVEELKKHADPKMRVLADSLPSVRSIARIRKNEWPSMPPAERASYGAFYWPESIERGDLPWEASEAALELLRELARSHWPYRPSIRAVKWFWHVCQAIPDAPFWLRIKAVANLMAAEDTSDHDTVRGVEWLFVSGYWRSEELKAEYMKATTRDEKPLPNLPRRSIGDIAEAGASSDAIECMMFSEFFDPMIRVIAINLNN